MFQRHLQLALGILFSSVSAAQTVPPAPVLSTPVQAPAVSSVTVKSDAAQCSDSSTACGLSNCECWVQLWRATCASATSCPAWSSGSYAELQNPVVQSATDDGNGGTIFVLTDTDPALTAGTIWQYVFTTNFAQYTPYTISAPSNPSGAVTIPAPASVTWKVYLTYSNPNCVTGQNCTANVYRATCTNATNCPSYSTSPSSFTAITVTTTQTVSSTGTNFQSVDAGTTLPLQNNMVYAYAVTNSFASNPSQPSGATQVVQVTPTGVHSATLNWSNASCRTASPCNLQVYRAQCSSTTSCPAYAAGSSSWKALNMSSGLTPTVSAQGTSWQYQDHDAALTGSTTYVWVATSSYSGSNVASPASSPFVGTTGVGRKEEKSK